MHKIELLATFFLCTTFLCYLFVQPSHITSVLKFDAANVSVDNFGGIIIFTSYIVGLTGTAEWYGQHCESSAVFP